MPDPQGLVHTIHDKNKDTKFQEDLSPFTKYVGIIPTNANKEVSHSAPYPSWSPLSVDRRSLPLRTVFQLHRYYMFPALPIIEIW